MTALQHVYITAHGTWKTGAWVGEGGQFGVRVTCEEVAQMPAKGAIYTPGPNGDVAVAQGTQSGTHGTLTKTWTARMGAVGSPNNFDATTQIDCAEDIWTFLDALKAYTATPFSWDKVKLCPVGADGKALSNSAVYTFTTPLAGTASPYLPPQCAAAISLRAPIIGRRGRGRFYLPGQVNTNLASDGTLASAFTTAARAAAVTLVHNLENLPGSPLYVPVVAIMSAGSATAVRPLEVRTGSRMDTIRSRREGVAETYTVTAL